MRDWNFAGMCSERKQKKVGQVVAKLNLDVVAVQESRERNSFTDVDGLKWFGKPRNNQTSSTREGGVGFLVCECLVDEVEFISKVKYEESVWMKVHGGIGRETLYIGCVFMPTDSNSLSVMDRVFMKSLRRICLVLNRKEG